MYIDRLPRFALVNLQISETDIRVVHRINDKALNDRTPNKGTSEQRDQIGRILGDYLPWVFF
jgi:hypothetical protein